MPVVNGEPVTCVRVPSDAIENTDTVLPVKPGNPIKPVLAVASSLPLGLNATDPGPIPVVNGEPLTAVNAPSDATENTDTLLSGGMLPLLPTASSPRRG